MPIIPAKAATGMNPTFTYRERLANRTTFLKKTIPASYVAPSIKAFIRGPKGHAKSLSAWCGSYRGRRRR